MHRAQILLEEWQYQALKAISVRTRQSTSSVLRNWISEQLTAQTTQSAISKIKGIANVQGLSGREHDKILYSKMRSS